MNKKLSLQEIKNLQVDMLKDIHNFCQNNEIKYSLAYGTLLGSIRHKGYIPWDDDIDIWMLRDDYIKFMNLYKSTRYKQVFKYKESGIPLPFGKVCDMETLLVENADHSVADGLYVDIFPMDFVEHKTHRFKKRLVEYLYKLKTIKEIRVSKNRPIYKNILLFILKSVTSIVKYELILQELNKVFINVPKREEKIKLTDFNDYKNFNEFNPDIFDKIEETDFENFKFFRFNDFDDILKKCYGDYMILPPMDKQVSHHDYHAYLRN